MPNNAFLPPAVSNANHAPHSITLRNAAQGRMKRPNALSRYLAELTPALRRIARTDKRKKRPALRARVHPAQVAAYDRTEQRLSNRKKKKRKR